MLYSFFTLTLVCSNLHLLFYSSSFICCQVRVLWSAIIFLVVFVSYDIFISSLVVFFVTITPTVLFIFGCHNDNAGIIFIWTSLFQGHHFTCTNFMRSWEQRQNTAMSFERSPATDKPFRNF